MTETPKLDWKKIKTFEDACACKKVEPKDVVDFNESIELTPKQKRRNATAKLEFVIEVMNEGVEPDYTPDNEQDKFEPVWYKKAVPGGGFLWVCNHNTIGHNLSVSGSRLVFLHHERMLHVVKQEQFQDLYNLHLSY